MIPLPSQTSRPAMSESFQFGEPRADRTLAALLVALTLHAAGAFYAGARETPRVAERPPVEVELAFREPPPPPPLAPEPPAPEPAEAVQKTVIAARPAAAPAAAKAGAVLTAAPDAPEPTSDEPFDFTSDPTSTVYGAGVVAVGGTATYGVRGAQAAGTSNVPMATAPKGDGLTAVSDLSERPRLRADDPCRGYFPRNALSDVATATVRVVIGKRGNVSSASVVSETPRGQGFGSAARTCMLEQVFSPALDRAGAPAATALNVNVKFTR